MTVLLLAVPRSSTMALMLRLTVDPDVVLRGQGGHGGGCRWPLGPRGRAERVVRDYQTGQREYGELWRE